MSSINLVLMDGAITAMTFLENARVVAQAVADYLKEEGSADLGVVLGYDSRLLPARYAEEVAAVLAGNGIKVFLTNKMVELFVVSFMVTNLHAAGGLMITASQILPTTTG